MAKRKVHSGYRNNRRRNGNNGRPAQAVAETRSNDSRGGKPAQQQSVLPPPSILQEYEYATEGAASRILEMAEVEQDRRNDWEDDYLRYYKKSLRIGQMCGFMFLIAVVMAFVYLSETGKSNAAIYLAAISFGSVALSNFFSSIGRRRNRRPRYKR